MSGPAYYMSKDELEEGLGADLAALVIRALGGDRCYLPREVSADHPLARKLGLENAAKLCSFVATERGGLHVEIPVGRSLLREDRLALLSRHPEYTEAQAARKLGVTGRTVRRLRATLRAKSRTKAVAARPG